MSITWTPQMQQVSDVIVAWHREHGRQPKLREIAEQIGVSTTRAEQIVRKIGRYHDQPQISDRFRQRLFNVRYAKLVLPIIEDAALAAAKRNRLRPVKDYIDESDPY